jgi:hypothetical protein
MTLMIIALLLFLAQVAAWIVLPGSAIAAPVQESAEPLTVTASQVA